MSFLVPSSNGLMKKPDFAPILSQGARTVDARRRSDGVGTAKGRDSLPNLLNQLRNGLLVSLGVNLRYCQALVAERETGGLQAADLTHVSRC